MFSFNGGMMSPSMETELERIEKQIHSERLAKSTVTKYEKNYKFWVAFCEAKGVTSLLNGNGPIAELKLLSQYVVFEHSFQKNAIGTIKTKLWAIRHCNMEFGLPNPLADKPRLDSLLKSLKKMKSNVDRKMPVTPQMLRYILRSADMTSIRTAGLVTSIVFAFMFLLRVGEFAAESPNVLGQHIIRRRHVVFKRNGFVTRDIHSADEIEILIPSSKTDQGGKGYVRNHFKTDDELCVVTMLAKWFEMTQDVDVNEPLFAFKIPTNPAFLDCVTRGRVDKVLKAAAHELGYPKGAISTHGIRRGAATAMISAGIDPGIVRLAGRWSSDIYKIYTYFTAGVMDGVARLMVKTNVAAPNHHLIRGG
jgi:hypothetical protein